MNPSDIGQWLEWTRLIAMDQNIDPVIRNHARGIVVREATEGRVRIDE